MRVNWTGALLAGVMAVTSCQACAQDVATAAKRVGVEGFAGFSRLAPDYGPYTDYGLLAGVDASHALRHFTPSVEFRYTRGTGSGVGESTFEGGLKAEKRFGRFNPYGDVLLGYGTITFDQPILFSTGPYAKDNSVIYVLGGGLDYDVGRNFSAKVDEQIQSWRLGNEVNRLAPIAFSVGLSYRIPFKALAGRR